MRPRFAGHECLGAGFAGLKNGELLAAAAGAGFDVVVTTDQEIPYQQNLEDRRISILILSGKTNRLADLEPLIPRAIGALRTIGRGKVARVR